MIALISSIAGCFFTVFVFRFVLHLAKVVDKLRLSGRTQQKEIDNLKSTIKKDRIAIADHLNELLKNKR
jgi:hypothetical protein